jgi:hypothetical protein
MLFFRSEEQVRAWCHQRGLEVCPIISLESQWQLAVAWYGNRLSPNARRPKPDEMRQIFAGVGLDGPFWDPEGCAE